MIVSFFRAYACRQNVGNGRRCAILVSNAPGCKHFESKLVNYELIKFTPTRSSQMLTTRTERKTICRWQAVVKRLAILNSGDMMKSDSEHAKLIRSQRRRCRRSRWSRRSGE